MISDTREDYIRAIDLLSNKGTVRQKDIVEYMGLAKSTVSERLKDLSHDGLIKYEKYSPIKITSKGKKIGKKLTFKHRLIEHFLYKVLKMDLTKIHDEAHKLEHAFSDEAIEHLDKFLERPKLDPHGEVIRK